MTGESIGKRTYIQVILIYMNPIDLKCRMWMHWA